MKEAVRRADRNWYMTADEALDRGLIAAVLEPGLATETEPAASDVRSTSLTPPGSVLGGPRASA